MSAQAAAQQSSIASSHPFTCNTCQVAFRSPELQRAHMQTDWHRYNLKRRVASLPPLSSEIFAEKVLANKATAEATAARASFERLCTACQKTYYSQNAYTNHLSSNKHRQNAARQVATSDAETASAMSSTFSLGDPVERAVPDQDAEEEFKEVVDGMKNASIEGDGPVSRRPSRPHHSSAEDRRPVNGASRDPSVASTATATTTTMTSKPIDPLLSCLFCSYTSPTFPTNLTHMRVHHSMYIPEQDYLTGAEGLINYLHLKVHEGHTCLYCNKQVHTATGIQTHMRDRGHCMVAFSSEDEQLELGDFYDFTSTYSDADGEDEGSGTGSSTSTTGPARHGGVKLGARREAKISTSDGEQDAEEGDDGWETDSTLSSVPTDEITSIPIADWSHRYKSLPLHRHHSHSDPRPHREADGWHSHAHPTPHAVYHDEYELHMPSGRVAGHRSLNRYFRQNLREATIKAWERRTITGGASVSSTDEDEDVDMDRSGQETPQAGELTRYRHVDREGGRAVTVRGQMGMTGVTAAKQNEVSRSEKRAKQKERRDVANYQWGNNKRSNNQKHFRDPLLQ